MPNASRSPRTKHSREPILGLEEYVYHHCELEERLVRYPYMGGRNKVELSKQLLDELNPRRAPELFANNATARINFVKIASEELSPFFLTQEHPLFWITLCRKEFTLDFEDALTFDPSTLQDWTREVLPGLSLVGMVDVGCYPVPRATHSRIWASFHVHLLAWGLTEAQVVELGTKINSKFEAFIPRRPAFHARRVSPEWANKLTFYMCKHPLKSSRFVSKLEWIDPFTGEVTERGNDRHYEERISSGRAARVAMLMQERYLDRLAFAAGEGTVLLNRITDRALQRFNASQRQKHGLDWQP